LKKERLLIIALVLLICSTVTPSYVSCDEWNATYGNYAGKFSLATGSPGELGLVEALANDFGKKNDASLLWKKAGSGESLKLLKDKKVDMIMVHAPAAEKKAVEEGWAVKRTLIGSNEFYIVGPEDDPAQIAKADSAKDAFKRIADKKALFFSRGDNSGTHKKEMELWNKTGITPSGDWYVVTKDFMKATLKRANNEKGYFMTDSSTWVAEKKNLPNLKILYRGDKFLVNTYHALAAPAGSTPGADIAGKFVDYLSSPAGQTIIRDYGKDKYGEGIYNDAAYAVKYDE
jgi:tungstate transport system substrate-binding protein